MRYITGLTLITILLATACSKDSIETKPSIKVKSIGSKNIQVNQDLSMTLDFTDKEADLSSIYIQKIRQNRRTTATLTDTFSLDISDFPKRTSGELQINLFYSLQLISAIQPPANPNSPTGFESDSLVFRLALRDKAANVSDTITTEQIVVQRIN